MVRKILLVQLCCKSSFFLCICLVSSLPLWSLCFLLQTRHYTHCWTVMQGDIILLCSMLCNLKGLALNARNKLTSQWKQTTPSYKASQLFLWINKWISTSLDYGLLFTRLKCPISNLHTLTAISWKSFWVQLTRSPRRKIGQYGFSSLS